MNERHKHADVLIAIAEGKEAQYEGVGEWVTVNKNRIDINPLTYPEFKWRIKPEPITVWVAMGPPTTVIALTERSKEAAIRRFKEDFNCEPSSCVPLTYTPGEGL